MNGSDYDYDFESELEVSPRLHSDDGETPLHSALIILTAFDLLHEHQYGEFDADMVAAVLTEIPAVNHFAASAAIIEILLSMLHSRAGMEPQESLSIARERLLNVTARLHDAGAND